MIELQHVSKIYRTPQGEVRSLDAVDLTIQTGEFVVIRGPSGCGKTTLLLTVGAMLKPTSGRVNVLGTELYQLGSRERSNFRGRELGFVFQMFHLIPYLTVEQNILLAGAADAPAADLPRVAALLEQLGLTGRRHHLPAELSTGEKQRTAIARALFRRPRLILADEPTGNLDPANAQEVFRHLQEFHRGGGTLVVVTHGAVNGLGADRVVSLKSGRIATAE